MKDGREINTLVPQHTLSVLTNSTLEMNTTDLTAFFALVAALSVATQKLVDIVKAWFPKLNAPPAEPPPPAAGEASRQRWVQVVAGACGCITAWAAWPAVQDLTLVRTMWHADWAGAYGLEKGVAVIFVGLLASGTSGPWNDLSNWLKSLSKPSS